MWVLSTSDESVIVNIFRFDAFYLWIFLLSYCLWKPKDEFENIPIPINIFTVHD